jgi:hypothetical protein
LRDFGEWGPVVRTLASYDPGRYHAVLRYPAGEALMAYEQKLRDEASRQHQAACQVWATLAATGASKNKRAPEPPAILKDRN